MISALSRPYIEASVPVLKQRGVSGCEVEVVPGLVVQTERILAQVPGQVHLIPCAHDWCTFGGAGLSPKSRTVGSATGRAGRLGIRSRFRSCIDVESAHPVLDFQEDTAISIVNALGDWMPCFKWIRGWS